MGSPLSLKVQGSSRVPAPPWVGSRSPDGWDKIPQWTGGWVLHQPPWSFGFDSQTRGSRENRSTPCVKVPGSSRVPAPPWVGSRSPDGWDQIPRWAGGRVLHQPPWTGVLGSIPKREELGKTGAPCVQVPGSSHRPRLVASRSTCPQLSPSPHANSFVIGTAVLNTHTPPPSGFEGWPCWIGRSGRDKGRKVLQQAIVVLSGLGDLPVQNVHLCKRTEHHQDATNVESESGFIKI